MNENTSKVLQRVNPARREFLQRVLAGVGFAAPVIASFTIDALTATPANAATLFPNQTFYPNSTCLTDAGYVGARAFLAHVSTAGGPPPAPPPPPATPPTPPNGGPNAPKVNGEVLLVLEGSNYLVSMQGEISVVPYATPLNFHIYIGPQAAVSIPLSGPVYSISSFNLNTKVVCDLDELADAIATGNATAVVAGTYNGKSFWATGGFALDNAYLGAS